MARPRISLFSKTPSTQIGRVAGQSGEVDLEASLPAQLPKRGFGAGLGWVGAFKGSTVWEVHGPQ